MKVKPGSTIRVALLMLAAALSVAGVAQGGEGVYRQSYSSDGWTLTVELLDDDLAHFQLSTSPVESIETSVMVAKTDYTGPSEVTIPEPGVLETPDMRLEIDADSLCVTVTDRVADTTLTTTCPLQDEKSLGLTLAQDGTTDIYGLGEQFPRRGDVDGNWIGKRWVSLNLYGNVMTQNNGGNVGSAQFPILYALGPDSQNYALFLDDVYRQYWTFTADPFTVTTSNDTLRWYIMTGADLPDLRRDYMELTGRPPVPPKQMFGLWVSEYGYDNWDEVNSVLQSLEDADFPLDGFVLDLLWFGGINGDSQIGSLSWDETDFPDPAAFIAALREQYGVGVMTIEESYVSDALADYNDLAAQGVLVRQCEATTCNPVHFNEWWGSGGMVDWTNPVATAWWHTNRRQHLIDEGVIGHWTDLGEPEDYDDSAWYYGFPDDNLHSEADVHNVYNLLWAKGIWDGYQQNHVQQRPFILSRSGTSGIQRYGAAMWSGDIAANMLSLQGQMNAQMHMSLSGVDYYGSDVGGFKRTVFDPVLGEDTTYTVWMANSALLDVPLRPHAYNLENNFATAPSLVGDVPSNLANVRLRYQLSPYLYTLAHQAYQTGDAVISPLVYHYQTDPAVRVMGGEKMIGADLLMTAITGYAIDSIKVYLPPGGWFNYYTHEYLDSSGEWLDVPTLVDGIRRAPLFVRDGAVIPTMLVDDQTMNMLGQRRDGSSSSIRFDIYQNDVPEGAFILTEDDGRTMAYQDGAVRETPVGYTSSGTTLTVTVGAAAGTYEDAPNQRTVQIQVTNGSAVTMVSLNGQTLSPVFSVQDYEQADSGWLVDDDGNLSVKAPTGDVTTPLVIQITRATP